MCLRDAPCASTPSTPYATNSGVPSSKVLRRQARACHSAMLRSRSPLFQLPAANGIVPPRVQEAFNMEPWSRRKFFLTSLAGSAIAGAGKLFGRTPSNGNGELSLASLGAAAQGKRPLIISSANGVHALDKGMDILKKGGDTLDAVVAAVTVVEDDPNDDSVGYGGLPNA